MKEYSDLIPSTILYGGELFYDYCGSCKVERMHFVYMIGANTIRHTVKFASVCHECWDNVSEYNQENSELQLTPDKTIFFTEYIFSIHHWNEFVENSKVNKEDYPVYVPVRPEDKANKP